MGVDKTVQELQRIKDKYKEFRVFPDKVVDDIATYLKQSSGFITDPVMFDDLNLQDFKLVVYSYVFYRLGYYMSSSIKPIIIKRNGIRDFCEFIIREEESQINLEKEKHSKIIKRCTIFFALLCKSRPN